MKRTVLTILVLLNTYYLFSQAKDNDDFIKRLEGLRQENYTFYELEGYNISTQVVHKSFTEKNIKKLCRKYKMLNNVKKYKDNTFGKNVLILHRIKKNDDNLILYSNYYIIDYGSENFALITFDIVNKNDSVLERKFVSKYINEGIPENVIVPLDIDYINFAGRRIELGSSCHYMGVRNIQCHYYGQMNWSLHTSIEDAQNNLKAYLNSAQDRIMYNLESSQDVNILFEGQETTAKRVIYKVKLPKFALGGSNHMIVYYVACHVRDYYVSCVLSHWTNDISAGNGLPPLLDKVMKLK